MKFTVNREALTSPLQQAAGVVERRQTLPILSNLLFRVADGNLEMTGTDLEVELIGRTEVNIEDPGEVTVSARKMVDICRGLPDEADISFELKNDRLEVRSGRFRSTLATLPAQDFPNSDPSNMDLTVDLPSGEFKRLLDMTGFAMAQQDVRYFLNGMLIELGDGRIRSVSTDGHRLALSGIDQKVLTNDVKQVIVPRKGIIEMQRLLQEVKKDEVSLSIGSAHLRAASDTFTLTTKLIDGKFPDYERVIPKNGEMVVLADRMDLHQALARTGLFSNEKFRGIRLKLESGQLQLSANNPEQEEAEETISVEYEGGELEVGFNVSYLQDVLSVLESEKVRLTLQDSNSSALIEDPEKEDSVFVVMPMKL